MNETCGNPALKRNLIWIPLVVVVLVATLLAGCDVFTCSESAERSAIASTEGVTTIRIVAEAGSLDVAGESGLTEMRAEGTACASATSDLNDIQFGVTTSGSEILVAARTPGGNSQFDVRITLPESMLVEIEDGSGNVDVRDVAGLRITDGSGDVHAAHIGGDLTVTDDGSGQLDLIDVAGLVHIQSDGSGDITVTDVGGGVRIGSDGSGSITVSNIGGNFEVESDGSGAINYSEVTGTVDIPSG